MQSVIEGAISDQGEQGRLIQQHELVKAIMGGRLLLCKVDLALPNLRILDSGTAQANWILDMARCPELHSTAMFIGTDIAPEHFPSPSVIPGNVKLYQQSIFDSWPQEWHDSFDVVHQRFVLAACKDATHAEKQGADAVRDLFKLVKPGGWLELHEGNLYTVMEGPQHAAMVRFRNLAIKAWKRLGQLPDPGVYIDTWLVDAGATDVYTEIQVVKIGAAAESNLDGQRAQAICLSLFEAIHNMVGGKTGFPSHDDFESLRIDLVKELTEVGNQWQYHLSYGRKPYSR